MRMFTNWITSIPRFQYKIGPGRTPRWDCSRNHVQRNMLSACHAHVQQDNGPHSFQSHLFPKEATDTRVHPAVDGEVKRLVDHVGHTKGRFNTAKHASLDLSGVQVLLRRPRYRAEARRQFNGLGILSSSAFPEATSGGLSISIESLSSRERLAD